jgi:hypothetical protein
VVEVAAAMPSAAQDRGIAKLLERLCGLHRPVPPQKVRVTRPVR